MNRRSFFSRLLPGALAASAAPSLLLPVSKGFKVFHGLPRAGFTQAQLDAWLRDLEPHQHTLYHPRDYLGEWRWISPSFTLVNGVLQLQPDIVTFRAQNPNYFTPC